MKDYAVVGQRLQDLIKNSNDEEVKELWNEIDHHIEFWELMEVLEECRYNMPE